MEELLDSLAWTILSDTLTQAGGDSPNETRPVVEAVRIAALNKVAISRVGYDYLNTEEGQLFLSTLSYESQRRGVSKKIVGNLARTIIENSKFDYHNEIHHLSLINFLDLLGRIHLLGSYRLPASLQQASSQRPLGVFYTPFSIADYIVNLALSPKLEECVRRIKKKGLSAVADLLSLSTVDPACGTGVFLVSTLRLMHKTIQDAKTALEKLGVSDGDYQDYFSNTTFNVCGVDIDTAALEIADVSLRFFESQGKSNLCGSNIGSRLKQGNSLITIDGFSHMSNNRHYFKNPESRVPFEWKKEFKEIFIAVDGGFDFVVMNPPYERLKPNLAEFLREELLSGEKQVHTSRYEDYTSTIRENTRYFRESNEYKHAVSYSINTYQLFIERALQISKMGGSIGCIVPSNILCDVSSQSLRRELLLQNSLNLIDDFPETSRVFPGVTQSVAIIVLTKGGQTEVVEVGLNRTSVKDAIRRKRFQIKRERIHKIMGNSLVIPRIEASDFMSLERMHKQPVLSSIDHLIVRRGELDLTMNKNFITSSKSDSRLIRGSHITRFSLRELNRDAEYANYDALRKALNESKRTEHITLNRIACQQISNMGQRWRLKFAPIEPLMILSNSCNYIVAVHPDSAKTLDFLLGVLNSELLNWRFQISNSNNHVSIRELQSLPIILPTSEQKTIEKEIIKDVRKLKTGAIDDSSSVEASVFALYGFGMKDAQRILRLRKTPEIEQKKIIDDLTSLVGERLSN
ncbi:MAG: Eco57I restriction-modification methylase domain-containing protein [Candidatus Odinarchaeota archaeon]